jgi:hypothetical protein
MYKLEIVDEERGGRRLFYKSSEAGETFQIVVEPEVDTFVRIDAHLLETWNEDQVHYVWEFGINRLQATLDVIMKTIDAWFKRENP